MARVVKFTNRPQFPGNLNVNDIIAYYHVDENLNNLKLDSNGNVVNLFDLAGRSSWGQFNAEQSAASQRPDIQTKSGNKALKGDESNDWIDSTIQISTPFQSDFAITVLVFLNPNGDVDYFYGIDTSSDDFIGQHHDDSNSVIRTVYWAQDVRDTLVTSFGSKSGQDIDQWQCFTLHVDVTNDLLKYRHKNINKVLTDTNNEILDADPTQLDLENSIGLMARQRLSDVLNHSGSWHKSWLFYTDTSKIDQVENDLIDLLR